MQSRDGDRLLRRLSELERRFSEVERELNHAQRLAGLGMFAGAIAHEFNNLLTPVVNGARLALAHPDDRALTEKSLRRVVESGERAAKISGAILGYLSDESGVTAADVDETVQHTLACLGREPAKDGVTLSVAVGKGCVAAISPGALQQVLLNLIVNALRAMRAAGSGGRLTIQAARSTWNRGKAGETPCVRIAVRDTGPGIPRAVRDRMFEPFVRPRQGGDVSDDRAPAPSRQGADSGARETRVPHGGTGLGLAICKRLIESSGGTIELRESSERGTTFEITLPATDGREAKAAA